MEWTARGKYKGEPAEITWHDGELTGSQPFIGALTSHARTEWRVGPATGPFTYENHLKDPLSAAILVWQMLDNPKLSGDVPKAPRIPKGAIA